MRVAQFVVALGLPMIREQPPSALLQVASGPDRKTLEEIGTHLRVLQLKYDTASFPRLFEADEAEHISAAVKDIQKRYRAFSMKFHPDRLRREETAKQLFTVIDDTARTKRERGEAAWRFQAMYLATVEAQKRINRAGERLVQILEVGWCPLEHCEEGQEQKLEPREVRAAIWEAQSLEPAAGERLPTWEDIVAPRNVDFEAEFEAWCATKGCSTAEDEAPAGAAEAAPSEQAPDELPSFKEWEETLRQEAPDELPSFMTREDEELEAKRRAKEEALRQRMQEEEARQEEWLQEEQPTFEEERTFEEEPTFEERYAHQAQQRQRQRQRRNQEQQRQEQTQRRKKEALKRGFEELQERQRKRARERSRAREQPTFEEQPPFEEERRRKKEAARQELKRGYEELKRKERLRKARGW